MLKTESSDKIKQKKKFWLQKQKQMRNDFMLTNGEIEWKQINTEDKEKNTSFTKQLSKSYENIRTLN